MKYMILAALLVLPLSSTQAGSLFITAPLFGEVVDPADPAFGETATGSFSYDPSLLTGIGDEELGVADGLLLDITFLGITFTETDDTDFDAYPVLDFFEGDPVGLDFVVVDGDGVGTEISDPRMDGFSFYELDPDPAGPGFFTTIATFIIVPEPTTAVLAGLGFCLWRRRR